MKTANLLVAALIGFTIGVVLGSGGMYQLSKEEAVKLREQIKAREARLDSLRTVVTLYTDSLQNANRVTTVETIKYHEIKPKSYSVPSLDSLFKSRYEK